MGYCQGTPLRAEIEAVDQGGLAAAIDGATDTLARQFGDRVRPLPRQALVVGLRK